ncbi:hypothetical protein Cpir12675_002458 [Ceratocystis pirilliformis]|uniref:WD repeat-containing protein WRAP73 n=1 Tax=Ceratocystis pirilliformis TaxID=259994 RepID=A0ABR3Z956_9PEZI
MFSSPIFKTSPFCVASPDGLLLAILQQARIVVREITTLQIVHEISIPNDAASSAFGLVWAPSSTKVLVAAGDKLLVYSALDSSFQATVKNPASSSAKPTHVQFGPTDSEVAVFSHFGLKLALVNLATSSVVEVTNPKFHQPPSVSRGISFRPGSHHLALLTRTNGKDSISIHLPGSRSVERAFHPDTVDAQGVLWASKGRWLIVWESAAHGHKMLMYTPDGHLFNTWAGPPDIGAEAQHFDLGAGVKHFHMDRLTTKAAVCDYTTTVTIMDLTIGSQMMRLAHPETVTPVDTLQVWLEQEQQPKNLPVFTRATQAFSPPERTTFTTAASSSDLASGCFLADFDCMSGLLATVTEAHRSTLWIWDLNSVDLRSVIMFHGIVSNVAWHPLVPELLLITCTTDSTAPSTVYVWDPLLGGPRPVASPAQLRKPTTKPGGTAGPKNRAAWISAQTELPLLLIHDGANGLVVAVGDAALDTAVSWGDNSHLSAKVLHGAAPAGPKVLDVAEMSFADEEGTVRVDDTFDFKKQKT